MDRIKIDESQPDHVILFPHGISDMETGDEDSEGMGFTLNFVLFSNCYVIVLWRNSPLKGNCPCLNEGKCIYLSEGSSEFYCDCPEYASGQLCNQLLACSSINDCPESDSCRLIAPGYHCENSITFDGDQCAHQTYSLLDVASISFSRIEFQVRTTVQNDTNLFRIRSKLIPIEPSDSESSDQLIDEPEDISLKNEITQIERISIDLDNGFLIVNLPDLPDLDLKSNHIVNDGLWHDVILEFFPTSKVMLLIDKVSHLLRNPYYVTF